MCSGASLVPLNALEQIPILIIGLYSFIGHGSLSFPNKPNPTRCRHCSGVVGILQDVCFLWIRVFRHSAAQLGPLPSAVCLWSNMKETPHAELAAWKRGEAYTSRRPRVGL